MAYYTALKELESFRKNTSCCFCKQQVNAELLYGKIYQYGEIVTHYFCMLFSSQMEQNGKDEEGVLGFLPADIKKELIRGQKLTCTFCHRDGATINCSVKTCKKKYHFPCAVNNGSLHQFYGQFRSFCYQHRRAQIVSPSACRPSEKVICLMCQEEVKSYPSLTTIWAPCCKTAWFHRLCTQRMAVSAGYFFKCPNCNNKDKFRSEMLECGIYIPDQDASWELEPNAFHELNERYNQCDAEVCQCPRGRSYSPTEGSWEIVRCNCCGSQGIHTLCGKDQITKKDEWTCSSCSSVVNKPPSNETSNPGPSVSTRRQTRRRRPRTRKKRNKSPEDTKESPPVKAIRTETTEDLNTETSKSETTISPSKYLYSNAGEAIQVGSIQATGDQVVEIGGINAVIEVNSSSEDDDDDDENPSNQKLPANTISNQLPLPISRVTTSTTGHTSLVIDLLDSDEESEENPAQTCSLSLRQNEKLSTGNADDEEDDDIIFMGHVPAKSPVENNPRALIRIVENDNVYVISPAEVKKRDAVNGTVCTMNNSSLSSSHINSTNVIWQSVPRNKSMLHSLIDNNCNNVSGVNRIMQNQQCSFPKFVSNNKGLTSNISEPITNGYHESRKSTEPINLYTEIIDLD